MDRTDLQRLVEELPETEIPTVAAFVSFVTHRAQQTPLDRILASAPYDDEEYTEEELAAIDKGIREAEMGQTIPFAQVKAELGLD
jgi:predicted transcriptional regulator